MLVGHKSVEDPEITVWTRNMSEASTGLTSIGVAAEQLSNRWLSAVKHMRALIDSFLPVYAPIEDADSTFKGVETPARTIERVKAVQSAMNHLESEAHVHANEMSNKVKHAVDQSKQEVKNISQLLTKRHHKKIDFDRVLASLASQAGKNGTTFDAENTNTEEQQLFETYDKRVREIVPKFLAEMDVILKRLVLLINTATARFYESLAKNLEQAAKDAGLHNTTLNETLNEWQMKFSAIKPAVEALSFCKGGRNEIPTHFEERPHVPGSTTISESFVGRAFNKVAQNVVMPRFVGGMGLFGDENALAKEDAEKAEEEAQRGEERGSSSPPPVPPKAGHEQWAEGLYPYKGDDGDLSFAAGEKILILDQGTDGDPNWWLGKKSDGTQGLFPKNYVKLSEPALPPRKKDRPLPPPPAEPVDETVVETVTKEPDQILETSAEPVAKVSETIKETKVEAAGDSEVVKLQHEVKVSDAKPETIEPIEAKEPVKPADTKEPVEVKEPVKATEPVEPAKPVEATKHIKPTEPEAEITPAAVEAETKPAATVEVEKVETEKLPTAEATKEDDLL